MNDGDTLVVELNLFETNKFIDIRNQLVKFLCKHLPYKVINSEVRLHKCTDIIILYNNLTITVHTISIFCIDTKVIHNESGLATTTKVNERFNRYALFGEVFNESCLDTEMKLFRLKL